MRKFVVAIATSLVASVALAPAIASASPYIHAHRGGALKTVGGELRPAFPENSLPAFRHSAKLGFVLEMDTRITSDGRAVVMHDASLKRTTDCTGLVSGAHAGRDPRGLRDRHPRNRRDLPAPRQQIRQAGQGSDDDPGAEGRQGSWGGGQPRGQQLSDRPRLRLDRRLRADGRPAGEGQWIPAQSTDPAELSARQPDSVPVRPLLRRREVLLPDLPELQQHRRRHRQGQRIRLHLAAVARQRRVDLRSTREGPAGRSVHVRRRR